MDHSQLSRHPREASTKVAPETLRNLRGIPTDPITSRSSSLQFFSSFGTRESARVWWLKAIGFYPKIDHFKELEAPNTQILSAIQRTLKHLQSTIKCAETGWKGHSCVLSEAKISPHLKQLGMAFSDRLSLAASKRRQQAASLPPNRQPYVFVCITYCTRDMRCVTQVMCNYSLQESSSTKSNLWRMIKARWTCSKTWWRHL